MKLTPPDPQEQVPQAPCTHSGELTVTPEGKRCATCKALIYASAVVRRITTPAAEDLPE